MGRVSRTVLRHLSLIAVVLLAALANLALGAAAHLDPLASTSSEQRWAATAADAEALTAPNPALPCPICGLLAQCASALASHTAALGELDTPLAACAARPVPQRAALRWAGTRGRAPPSALL
jgi:hypothetical protein